jgi:hypothetical protein
MFKLIQNRYYFYNYKKIFNKALFGLILFIPNKLDLNILKQKDINFFLIKKNLLKIFFKVNFSLFTGFNYFFVFKNFEQMITYQIFLAKYSNIAKIFFFKVNNYFISIPLFNIFKKVKSKFQTGFMFQIIFIFQILFFILRFFLGFIYFFSSNSNKLK